MRAPGQRPSGEPTATLPPSILYVSSASELRVGLSTTRLSFAHLPVLTPTTSLDFSLQFPAPSAAWVIQRSREGRNVGSSQAPKAVLGVPPGHATVWFVADLFAQTFQLPPPGIAVPNAREVQAIGAHGATASAAHRRELMNKIGFILGIPVGGWSHGQSRLFEQGDIRLVWLFRRLAVRSAAQRVAKNLERVEGLSGAETMLTMATTAREHSPALTDVSSRMIDSWHEGGLDFLWAEKDRLGLPNSVTRTWIKIDPFLSAETNNYVHPAWIPARDQMLIYAAQIRTSFERNFLSHVSTVAGPMARSRVAMTSRPALLVWKAYSFLAPGGAQYDPKKSIAAQSGQGFGSGSAVQALAHLVGSDSLDLDAILRVPELNSVEWVRSAKIRAAEALFLERLLTVARELLPPAWLHG
jgi:hypothetical protein